MNLEFYMEVEDSILKEALSRDVALIKYIKLMEIFVQDCAVDKSQPYFGNITKQKAKILFNIQGAIYQTHDIKVRT